MRLNIFFPYCTVTNGPHCQILGEVTLSFRVCDQQRVLDVLVVPEVEHQLILGTDFWRIISIIRDLRRGEWVIS